MMEGTFLYDEVFCSIQGESSDAGFPCVFVRFYGCDVGCSFCDQPQCSSDRKKIGIDNLMRQITAYGIPNVCITGGDPMKQWDNVYVLVLELVQMGYKVSIETSGCYPIDADPYSRSFKYVMDIKCPSSGVSHKNIYDNLMNLQPKDEVKFVISDERDYKFMKRILSQYPTPAQILVSPCFDKDLKPVIGSELVEWLIRDRLYRIRVSLQMHKFMGVQ